MELKRTGQEDWTRGTEEDWTCGTIIADSSLIAVLAKPQSTKIELMNLCEQVVIV